MSTPETPDGPLRDVRDPLELALARVVAFFGGNASPISYTVLAFLFVLLKALFASRFDTTTASALLEASGIGSVVAGAVALSMPFVSGVVFFLAFAPYEVGRAARWPTGWARVVSALALLVRVVAVVLAVTAVPLAMVVLTLVALLVFRGRRLAPASVLAAGAVTVFVLMLVSDRLWIPVENLELSSSATECTPITDDDVCTAYVVEDDGEWTTVLTSDERRIVRLRSELITGRVVCRVDPVYAKSVYMLVHPLVDDTLPRWWSRDC